MTRIGSPQWCGEAAGQVVARLVQSVLDAERAREASRIHGMIGAENV